MNFKKAILIFCSVVVFAPSGYSQSVSDSAGTTSSANKSAATIAYIEAAGLFATSAFEASRCSGSDPSACAIAAVTAAMGILSVEQGNANNAAAGDAGTTDGESSIGTSDTSSSTTTGTSTTTTSGDDATTQAYQAAKSAQQALNTAGVATTSTSATAPDGTTANTSSVGSQAALAGSGLPQSVIDAAMQAVTNAEKAAEAKVKMSAGLEDGGGGGGSGGPQGPSDDDGKDKLKKIAKAPVVPKRDPAQMAGLQKNYNGEPIGVAQDDIFLMMSRRYKLKDSQDTFLHENEIMLRK